MLVYINKLNMHKVHEKYDTMTFEDDQEFLKIFRN